ncbi:TetR/AcrR family transcriptional regulator [Okibacterium endophyticum]
MTKRRRRGATLEAAVLDAAWAEITQHGYADFTVDAVAARAGTSKAVLYRRWPGKPELAQAAIERVLAKDPITVPDTGSLRGDTIELLRQASQRRVGIATHMIASLGEFYRETGNSLATLRDTVAAGQESVMVPIVDRAVERGEIGPDKPTRRIIRLPIDLLRLELLMTSEPPTDDDIIEIVDTVFLPLVMS